LEYFEGIMFLTTNRVGSIDPAFKSRIHLSILYPALSVGSRREIWRGFIMQGSAKYRPHWLDDGFLDLVAGEQINGRQIKNIVRMAYALASNGNREMEPKDILSGLEALKDFESDFQSSRQALVRRTKSLLKSPCDE
jgi:hypothetical protein